MFWSDCGQKYPPTAEGLLALVFPHPLRLPENVTCHRLLYFLPARAGFQIKLPIQSVESIEITMSFSGRRAGTVVADLVEIIAPLSFASW